MGKKVALEHFDSVGSRKIKVIKIDKLSNNLILLVSGSLSHLKLR